jgi:hypothetical protein
MRRGDCGQRKLGFKLSAVAVAGAAGCGCILKGYIKFLKVLLLVSYLLLKELLLKE